MVSGNVPDRSVLRRCMLANCRVISAKLENKPRKTYAMYREGMMSNSVSTMRRNEGNRRRDAKMRRMARGVVSRADWYAIVKSSASTSTH